VHALSKGISAVSKEMHTGLGRVNNDISGINRSLLEIKPFLAAMKKP